MTEEQIKQHFEDRPVSRFSGTLQELADLHMQVGCSYNYLVVSGEIYFVSERPVVDARAIPI